jgi:hypothetical protein
VRPQRGHGPARDGAVPPILHRRPARSRPQAPWIVRPRAAANAAAATTTASADDGLRACHDLSRMNGDLRHLVAEFRV